MTWDDITTILQLVTIIDRDDNWTVCVADADYLLQHVCIYLVPHPTHLMRGRRHLTALGWPYHHTTAVTSPTPRPLCHHKAYLAMWPSLTPSCRVPYNRDIVGTVPGV